MFHLKKKKKKTGEVQQLAIHWSLGNRSENNFLVEKIRGIPQNRKDDIQGWLGSYIEEAQSLECLFILRKSLDTASEFLTLSQVWQGQPYM